MDYCSESEDETETKSVRSSLTDGSPITSSFKSNRGYVPTLFEEIISSQEDEERSINSMGSVRNVVCNIISRLEMNEGDENMVCTTAPDAQVDNKPETVSNSAEDEGRESLSTQSSDDSDEDEEETEKETKQKKVDIARERKRIEKLFGVPCHEEDINQIVSPEPKTKVEELYIEQCGSWFKRTTRHTNQKRQLIDDLAVEELPTPKRTVKRKRTLTEIGGGDE